MDEEEIKKEVQEQHDHLQELLKYWSGPDFNRDLTGWIENKEYDKISAHNEAMREFLLSFSNLPGIAGTPLEGEVKERVSDLRRATHKLNEFLSNENRKNSED